MSKQATPPPETPPAPPAPPPTPAALAAAILCRARGDGTHAAEAFVRGLDESEVSVLAALKVGQPDFAERFAAVLNAIADRQAKKQEG